METPSSSPPEDPTVGRLEGIAFPELLWSLCHAGRTGVLEIAGGFRSWLYFDRGRVVFAASADPDRRIGTLLLRRGAIRLDELRSALERQRPGGQRLGVLLVEAGYLGEPELVDALRTQYRDVILDLFALDTGEYRFREGQLPSDEPITLADSPQDLIHAGIGRVRSFTRVRREVGGPTTLYALTPDWRERVEGLTPGDGQAEILDRLERGEESVEYLCRDVLLSNFQIHQALWTLRVLGAVRVVAPGGETDDDDAFRRPEPGEDFVAFLLRLCRSGETGVLYAIPHRTDLHVADREVVERTFHLREGRCIFATSSNTDDGLVTHLLRRGVIGLRDREEATHRVLTNKRVGTILLELGVLDDEELQDAVRQQLGEIVWDTLGWGAGDYTFVDGPLPSTEEITLDLDIEALIAEGLRRVTSWSRVREGCGGLRSRLRLSPSYLEVLDAMGGGVEEWEVVAALREPKTPLEVCAATSLDDFRICQLLWCLKLFGAVELEESVADTAVEPDVVHQFTPRPLTVPIDDLDEPREWSVESVPVDAEAADAPAESFWDVERVTRTQRISRVDVERALRGGFEGLESLKPEPPAAEAEPAEAEPAEVSVADEGWEPPAELDRAISRFNAVQRLVYSTARAEIGAGAANFMRSCCVDADQATIGGSSLNDDGSWDAEGLREAAVGSRLAEPWDAYRELIDREIEQLREFIGKVQADALADKIERVAARESLR